MKKLFLIVITLVPFITKAQVTLIPDATFEQLLINLGIDTDGVLNGQMLTSDAQNVTQLNLFQGANGFYIQNIKGIESFVNLKKFEGRFHNLNNLNLTTLPQLETLILPSNNLSKINLSNNINLETLIIGNDVLEFLNLNTIGSLDLSNNINLKLLNTYNSFPYKINLRNHAASSLKIVLGNENDKPYNVCIEVDDPIAATNGTAPYDNWSIINYMPGTYYFNANCALSVEKFVNENFKIYPNPATQYVVLEQKTTEGVNLQAVQILDNSGKLIRTVKENFNYIDVSTLSKGMYLFVIQTDKGNKTEKIIIE
ncbi:T9SS type A sorting domain-containing protein [Myroides sp. JBRI-B21084]|uniref:T9SS type A sorting domain-containing protein n=1 Tax=Myroides sp. JBRI-B21084 TaxID=3119977 RepID=UPI0026E22F59|nr:T9SS type A sorting domain-containing protein [Paenimyroides cloacae]WKW46222.1 T9SS type A sorting domain-containing protein [Paenimyroides cloacae]